jgi:hypothetical protein
VGNGSAGTEKLMFTAGHNSNPVHINSAKMTIQQDGKVGFGTTSPAADVHFYQGPDNRVMIESNGPTLVFKEINSTNQNWAFYLNAGALNIRTLADNFGSIVDRMTFLQDGNVGIGYNSPTAPVHVSRHTQTAGTQVDILNLYTNALNDLDGEAWINIGSSSATNLPGRPYVRIGANRRDSSSPQMASMTFWTRENAVDEITERMRIDPAGNVGIGDNLIAPEHRLHVSGDAIISGVLYDSTNSSGAAGHVFTSEVGGPQWKMIEDVLSGVGGNGTAEYIPRWVDADTIGDSVIAQSGSAIGIGTAAPEKDLTIESATSPALGLYSTYADTNARNWAINTNNASYGDFTIATSAARLGNPSAIKMTILKDGNVGIGIAAPVGDLHVKSPANEHCYFNIDTA